MNYPYPCRLTLSLHNSYVEVSDSKVSVASTSVTIDQCRYPMVNAA